MNDPFQQSLKQFSKNPSLIFSPRAISYFQLSDYARSTAKQLKKMGVQKGTRVAIVAPNSAEYVIVLWALWKMGAVACLLSVRTPIAAIEDSLKSISCSMLLCADAEIFKSKKVSARKFRLDGMINNDVRHFASGTEESLDLEQEATIVWTSGSAGEPKAVVHTLGNHYYSALGANEHIPLAVGDRWLLSLPLYHVAGLAVLFRALLGGAAVVVPSAADDLFSTIKKQGITHVSLVPTQLFRMLEQSKEQSFPKLKAVLVGGSSIAFSLIEKAVAAGIPLHTTYGLTEMASQVATTGVITQKSFENFSAKILAYREIKIEKDGEILVRGKTLCKGYLEGSKINLPLNPGGWFATGDLGKMVKKDFIKVTGRKDNMFISGGENIHPEEIEGLLCRLAPIRDAVVIPVRHEEFGQRPVAIVKAGSSLTIEEIRTFLEGKIPRFKIPESFYLWPEEVEGNGLKTNRQEISGLFLSNPKLFKKFL